MGARGGAREYANSQTRGYCALWAEHSAVVAIYGKWAFLKNGIPALRTGVLLLFFNRPRQSAIGQRPAEQGKEKHGPSTPQSTKARTTRSTTEPRATRAGLVLAQPALLAQLRCAGLLRPRSHSHRATSTNTCQYHMTTDGNITRAIDNHSPRRGFGDRIPSNFWEVQIPFNPPLSSSQHHHLTQPSLANATAERENSRQTVLVQLATVLVPPAIRRGMPSPLRE